MILWITGNSRAGKTTLAKWLIEMLYNNAGIQPVWLDGDAMRRLWPELGYSMDDRALNNVRIARLASLLHDQGHTVIVSTICPTKAIRDLVRGVCGIGTVKFVYLMGGKEPSAQYPYQGRQPEENL